MKNEVIEGLEYNEEEGILSYKGIRYFLIRPETLLEIYQNMKAHATVMTDDAFFNAGYKGVSLSMKAYKEEFGIEAKDMIPFVINMGSLLGWGKLSLLSMESDVRRMIFEVKNSVFAQGPASSEPVCHTLRGVFTAIGEAFFQEKVDCQEVKCLAMGDPECRFIITGQQESNV